MFLSQPLFSHLNNNKGIFYKHLFFIITRDTNQHLLQHFMGPCLVPYFPVIYIIFLISHQLSEFYFEIFNIIHPKNMRKQNTPWQIWWHDFAVFDKNDKTMPDKTSQTKTTKFHIKGSAYLTSYRANLAYRIFTILSLHKYNHLNFRKCFTLPRK